MLLQNFYLQTMVQKSQTFTLTDAAAFRNILNSALELCVKVLEDSIVMSDPENNSYSWNDYSDSLPPWWKEHYQELFTAEEYFLQNLMLDVTHEFLVPLIAIQKYAELIREHIPETELEKLRLSEDLTMKYMLEVIIKMAKRQNMMIQFVRWEAWEKHSALDAE